MTRCANWPGTGSFGDYHRRLAEVVQTVSETCEDPVAYLAALRDWQAPTGGGS